MRYLHCIWTVYSARLGAGAGALRGVGDVLAAGAGGDVARPPALLPLAAAQLPHGRGASVPRALDTPALRSTQGQD